MNGEELESAGGYISLIFGGKGVSEAWKAHCQQLDRSVATGVGLRAAGVFDWHHIQDIQGHTLDYFSFPT